MHVRYILRTKRVENRQNTVRMRQKCGPKDPCTSKTALAQDTSISIGTHASAADAKAVWAASRSGGSVDLHAARMKSFRKPIKTHHAIHVM